MIQIQRGVCRVAIAIAVAMMIGRAVAGPAVDEAVLAGDFRSTGAVCDSVETVTAPRPFDSVSFNLGFSTSDRFFSIYQPGFLLFIR